MNLKNMTKTTRHYLPVGLLVLTVAATGCTTANVTNPPRSVTEQLLLSTATDRAIASVGLPTVQGKKVYIDGTYFDSYDSKYVIGSIRDAFSRAGALLVENATNSEYIVEARSGGLSIDASESLFGLPGTGVPIPLAGSVSIPEIAFYKNDSQHSIAKFALLVYATQSRQHIYSSGPMVGKSYNKYYKILLGLISWNTTDIPEKK